MGATCCLVQRSSTPSKAARTREQGRGVSTTGTATHTEPSRNYGSGRQASRAAKGRASAPAQVARTGGG
jgi:hypothetical protein